MLAHAKSLDSQDTLSGAVWGGLRNFPTRPPTVLRKDDFEKALDNVGLPFACENNAAGRPTVSTAVCFHSHPLK